MAGYWHIFLLFSVSPRIGAGFWRSSASAKRFGCLAGGFGRFAESSGWLAKALG
jgi:hypothetical protein